MIPAASLKVRQAYLTDYSQVAELEARYGLATKSREEWEHLWLENPVYRQFEKEWPIGWVAENAGGRVIGYIGNIPLRYHFRGTELLAATSRAWVIDSNYRPYSLLLLDHFFAQPKVDLFLTTSLSAEASEGFRSFNPSPVPVGDWDHSVFWITNYSGFITSSLTRKEVPFPKVFSYAVSVPLFARDKLTNWYLNTHASKVDVDVCTDFDDRFDVFWRTLRRNRSQLLLGSRSRDVLTWHFKYALSQDKAWILCVSDKFRLVAYSIFYRQDNSRCGLKRVRLIDFQTLDGDNSRLLSMIRYALKRCRTEGIHMLEIIGFHDDRIRVVKKAAPYRRKLPSYLSFYRTNNKQLAIVLREPSVWDLSCFDGDFTL